MKLAPPLSAHISGAKPTHSPTAKLGTYVKLCKQAEIEALFAQAGYLSQGKITRKAATDGLVDSCDGKVVWNLRKVKVALLELTRKPAPAKKPVAKPIVPVARPKASGPVWTDLENIGTYFGAGKNKVGTWLDSLGLRGYKPMQVNESGAVDMLDVANASKEKFQVKIPTEKALAQGYAKMDVIEYKQKGKDKSFEKYSWNLELVKAVLVKAGHPLDTERKLLLKGKGKNSNVKVETLDDRAAKLHAEWKKLHSNSKTRAQSWALFNKQPTPLLTRVEMLMGRPRYLQDKLYLKEK